MGVKGEINFVGTCTKKCIGGIIEEMCDGFMVKIHELNDGTVTVKVKSGTQCGDAKEVAKYFRMLADKLDNND